MKIDATTTFRPGCYHRNRKGIYLIKQADGNRLLCEYMDGISFEGNASLLHNIEFKLLGYNLPSPQVARDLLRKIGVDLTKLQPFEIIVNAGRLIKESLDEEDRLAIQAIYERQMKLFGAQQWISGRLRYMGENQGATSARISLCFLIFSMSVPSVVEWFVALVGRASATMCDRVQVSKSNSKKECPTRRDTATPISRPVFMPFRSFNINPVIDVRPR